MASAELLHPLSLHLENPLVLNKCFTLADLPGIFICGVAAATAAMLTPPPPPRPPFARLLHPCAAICTFRRRSRNRHRSHNNGNNGGYRCSQDVWGYRFPRVKLFHSNVNVLGANYRVGALPQERTMILILCRLRIITLIPLPNSRPYPIIYGRFVIYRAATSSGPTISCSSRNNDISKSARIYTRGVRRDAKLFSPSLNVSDIYSPAEPRRKLVGSCRGPTRAILGRPRSLKFRSRAAEIGDAPWGDRKFRSVRHIVCTE